MNEEKKIRWVRVIGMLLGAGVIAALLWSCLKEEPRIIENSIEKNRVQENLPLPVVEPAELTPSEIYLDTEPNCEEEECKEELALERPIFSKIPAHLQERCNIYFSHNSAVLSKHATALLEDHLKYLKKAGRADHLVIEAYVDPEECEEVESGTLRQERQVALSAQRAAHIKTLLESRGIEAERIKVISYGAKAPRSDVDDERIGSSVEANRRALLVYHRR